MKTVQTTRELNRPPFYTLPGGVFGTIFTETSERIMVCVPMKEHGRPSGLLYLTYQQHGPHDAFHLPYERFSLDFKPATTPVNYYLVQKQSHYTDYYLVRAPGEEGLTDLVKQGVEFPYASDSDPTDGTVSWKIIPEEEAQSICTQFATVPIDASEN